MSEIGVMKESISNYIYHKFPKDQKCLVCGTSDNEAFYLLPRDYRVIEEANTHEYVHVKCISKGILRYNHETRLIYWQFEPFRREWNEKQTQRKEENNVE